MTIHIDRLEVEAIIGLLDFEREKPQRILVDLYADYRYHNDGNYVDYAQMVENIEDNLKQNRYTLLEDALIAIKVMLLQNYPQLQTLFVKISKPDILPSASVALSNQWDFSKSQ